MQAPTPKSPRLPFALAALAVASLLVPLSASAASVRVFDSLATIRTDRPLPAGGASSVELSAAANEFESFQVAVDAGSVPLGGVRVDQGAPIAGPGGATIPAENVTVYREVDYDATRASDNEGGVGRWPDALIPERDYFYGEDRNAFPVDLGAGQRVVAWIDILVPADAAPGSYSGSVLVRGDGGLHVEVPVRLRVEAFAIPSTSSLPSAFFANPWKMCVAHTDAYDCNNQDEASWKLHSLYARAALENRMTIPNILQFTYEDVPVSGAARTLFERYGVPLLNGTDSSIRLPGARLTTVAANDDCVMATGCLQGWKNLASTYGFSSRYFAYLCDEPYADEGVWSSCNSAAQRSAQIWPAARRLITTSVKDASDNGGSWSGGLGYTDVLAPPINYMADRRGQYAGNQRPSYDGFLDPARNRSGSAANELWMYTSCLSFSCDESEDQPGTESQWSGWPGYAIDQPASQARAMGWLSYEYGASGELFWDSAVSLASAWTDQYVSGGNGDGNLFYPGTADGSGGVPIGGAHDIPIESIRMKRIRDGREDYEYLRLLGQQGKGGAAMDVTRSVFGSQAKAAHSTTVDSASIGTARAQLAALIMNTAVQVRTTATAAPVGGAALDAAREVSGSGAEGSTSRKLRSSGRVKGSGLRLKILRVKAPKSIDQLRRRGVRALVKCSVACRVNLGSEMSRGAARQIGMKTTRLGSGTIRLAAGRRGWVRAPLTASVRAMLARAQTIGFRLRTDFRSRPI